MITVFGSISLDHIGAVTRFPTPGETVVGHSFSTAPGGKGANQALAARRAGAQVRLIGAVGNDTVARSSLELLQAAGVDLAAVRVAPGHTGIAMVSVDASGENSIAVFAGANGSIGASDVDRELALIGHSDIVLLQQEIPQAANARALQLAKERGAVTILNTAPLLADTAKLAPLAGILVANESEFCLLAGCDPAGLDLAMTDWHSLHAQIVIVTRGAKGAVVQWAGRRYQAIAEPIVVTDTVGAGDTFCGYLAAGLEQGLEIPAAVQRAVFAASMACTRPGAQQGIPYAAEIDTAAD